MRCGYSRSLPKILSLCILLILAALPARADGERRFAPKATTPEALGRPYLTFVLIPAMREALAKLPGGAASRHGGQGGGLVYSGLRAPIR